MAVEVARASIAVTAVGGDKALAEVAASAVKWGKKAGAQFSANLAFGMTQDLDKAKSQVESAKAAVEKASAATEKAYNRQADAAGRVRVAAQGLKDAQDAGHAASRRGLAAAEALARADRDLKSADDAVADSERKRKVSTDELVLAERRLTQEQQRADEQQRKRSSGFSIFGTVAGKAKSQMAGIGSELLAFGTRFAAPVAAITAAGEAFKASFDTGVDFTKSLNTMKAVSDATGDDMAKVAAKARELGNDISLPATSANDAAAAMTELAKGGFDVQQSMDAAKGSLQLAAAAGVPAGQAAMIQSQLLHAFGLSAVDAGRAADVLSNAANQSSAEITDIAYGMQQAGTVAHGFKISMEDTATALSVLSNAGIQGSDAGTSLKTFLTSLTDQGKPAQNAIRELGLTVYDAQGRFTGLRTLFDQLTAASKRMTDEQFQAATATLFGTDAIRGSMVAAANGADGWDKMREKIGQAGAAAKVAAAKTEGVPGALERMKNAAESLGLSFYDLVKVPVGAAFDGIAAGIGALEDVMNSAVSGARALFQSFKDSGGLDRLQQSLSRVWAFLKPGFDSISSGLKEIWNAVAGTASKFQPLTDALGRLMVSLKPVAEFIGGVLLTALRGLLEGAGALFSGLAPILSGALGFIIDGLTMLTNFLSGAVDFITSVFHGIGAVATWLWREVFAPIFNGLVVDAQVFWSGFQYVWSNVEAIIKVVGKVFEWLNDNVVGPILSSIGSAFQTLYDGYVKPAMDFVVGKFDEVSRAVSGFWSEHVSPLIADLKSGWDQLMKDAQPILDFFENVFQGIGKAASSVADGVKSAFQGLMEIVKVPVHWIGQFLSSVPVSLMGVEVPALKDLHEFGARLQAFAVGGVVAGRTSAGVLYGPGTGTSDGIVGVDKSGTPTALVSSGEGIVTARAMARGGSALVAALNAGWVPSPEFLRGMLPGFADGGAIGAAMDFARSASGRVKYHMGHQDAAESDCSGFVSSVVNIATGSAGPYGERMNTVVEGQWLAARGFVNGSGGPGTLRVGWYDRGGGANGHTAGTMPDGTPFECSSDKGAVLGSGARGADDSMFDHHMYLPLGPQLPGSGGSGAPAGGSSSSPASGGSAAGSSSGSSGAAGGYIGAKSERGHQADERALQEAKDRAQDTQTQLDNAQRRLDELKRKETEKGKVSGLQLDKAQQAIDRADREHNEAVSRLAQAQARVDAYDPAHTDKQERGGSGQGQGDAKSLAQGFGEGLLQVVGLGDSGLFSNPLDWPVVKMLTGFVSWATKPQGGSGQTGAGSLGILGDAGAQPGSPDGGYSPADFTGAGGGDPTANAGTLATGLLGSATNAAQPAQAGRGDGPYVDQSVTVNGNIGDSYSDVRNQVARDQNLAARRYEGQLVRQ